MIQQHRPEEEREGKVEGSQPQGPKIAGLIQHSAHIALRVPCPGFTRRHSYEKTDMAVIPDGLHVEHKCCQKTEENGEVLNRRPHSAVII